MSDIMVLLQAMAVHTARRLETGSLRPASSTCRYCGPMNQDMRPPDTLKLRRTCSTITSNS